jgi:hypothetical protein
MAEKYYRQSRSQHNRVVREDESQKKSKIICHDKLQRPQEQLRLFKLLPGSFDQPLKGEIQMHLVENAKDLRYIALSYTWNTENPNQKSMKLGEKEVLIQDNLSRALKAMRKENKAILMWIDALCIDQSNLHELSAQVGIMSSIYANAKRVQVWLGSAKKQSCEMRLFECLESGQVSESNERGHRDTTKSGSKINRQMKNLSQYFTTLCHRSYWHRAWIKQELYFAQRIKLFCGCRRLKWETFTEFCSAVKTHLKPNPQIEHVLRLAEQRGQSESLLNLVIGYHQSKSTRLVDCIYSLLPMARDKPESKGLVPDYHSELEDVLIRTMAVCRPKDEREFAQMLGKRFGILPQEHLDSKIELWISKAATLGKRSKEDRDANSLMPSRKSERKSKKQARRETIVRGEANLDNGN